MRRGFFMLSLLAGIMLLTFLSVSLAQNPAPAAPAPAATPSDEMKYSFGTVVKVGEGEIVVQEYDYSKDEEVEMTYAVTSETQYDNIGSLKEFAKDDNIEIYYKEAEGEKIATILIKENPMEEDLTEEIPVGNIMEEEMNEMVPAMEPAPPTNVMMNEMMEAPAAADSRG